MFFLYRVCVGCYSINVVLKPTDTAREVGLNVTLACIVLNKAASESVQWKHVSNRHLYSHHISFKTLIVYVPIPRLESNILTY